ncbi:hypothetical protein [Anaerophilus nitritogenes]|uniref:hypothetical protein n=1 Tax=Anaerophilus nitritogenes TaxID=2498136 RepID=UPI00101D1E7C|nr:hypothetical protein [Anaerophilus nitritogenes]
MENHMGSSRKAEVVMRFSEFEMPPMQDVLIVGRKAPIGPEAARRMVEVVSPGQYEIIKVEDSKVEALVIRKILLNMLKKEKIIDLIMEEGGKVANESMIIKVQMNITFQVSKSIDL